MYQTSNLEFAAELFLDADFSLAFLKLRARLSSLLKLLTLLRLGLARCGLSSGELAGSGERQPRGEGDLGQPFTIHCRELVGTKKFF